MTKKSGQDEESSPGAVRATLAAAISLACMTPAMAVNAIHRIGETASPSSMGYALAAASSASVLLAAASLHLSRQKSSDTSLRAIAIAAFVVCTGYNLQCAIGAASTTRGDMAGSRKADIGKKRLMEGQIVQAEKSRAELAKVAGEETASMVEATLNELRNDPKWSRSKKCEAVTLDDSRAFCIEYANKLRHYAAALRIGDLDREISDLKSRIINATGSTAEQPADAQSDNVATLLGMIGVSAEAAKIGITLNFWFAITLEVLGTAGPILLNSVLFPTRKTGIRVTQGELVISPQIDTNYELVMDSQLRGELRAPEDEKPRITSSTSQTRNPTSLTRNTSQEPPRNARNALIGNDVTNVVPLRVEAPEAPKERWELVMELRNQGLSNCEIARALGVSEGTVRLDVKKGTATRSAAATE